MRTREEFPVDQWGHPIRYEVVNGTFKLYSNGKLGKPRGIGSYAQPVAREPDPAPGPPPTFGQFLTEPKTFPLQAACILGGVAAFPVRLSQAPEQGGKRPTLGQLLALNLVTAVFATFAALVIGMLHIIRRGTKPCPFATSAIRSSLCAWRRISSTGSC